MNIVIDFILSALPWILMGIFIAYFMAKKSNKKMDQSDNHDSI